MKHFCYCPECEVTFELVGDYTPDQIATFRCPTLACDGTIEAKISREQSPPPVISPVRSGYEALSVVDPRPLRCVVCDELLPQRPVFWAHHLTDHYQGPEVPLCSSCGESNEVRSETVFAAVAARFAKGEQIPAITVLRYGRVIRGSWRAYPRGVIPPERLAGKMWESRFSHYHFRLRDESAGPLAGTTYLFVEGTDG